MAIFFQIPFGPQVAGQAMTRGLNPKAKTRAKAKAKSAAAPKPSEPTSAPGAGAAENWASKPWLEDPCFDDFGSNLYFWMLLHAATQIDWGRSWLAWENPSNQNRTEKKSHLSHLALPVAEFSLLTNKPWGYKPRQHPFLFCSWCPGGGLDASKTRSLKRLPGKPENPCLDHVAINPWWYHHGLVNDPFRESWTSPSNGHYRR